MNILFVTRRYKPFSGGAENQIARIAEALSRAGHNVRVYTGRHDISLPARLEENCVMVKRFTEPSKRFLGSIVFLLQVISHMLWSDRKYYDIVFTSMINETSAMAILVTKLLNRKVFFRPSSKANFEPIDASLKNKLYFHISQLADGMITQTEKLKKVALSYGYPAGKIVIVPNMIDKARFIKRDFMRKQDVLRILWCGRLHEVKNPLLLPCIAQELITREIKFHIDVVGNGDLQTALENEIRRLQQEDYFTLHGYKKDTLAFYRDTDIYLLTSDSDAMPNTVLEAMAANLPIVATNVDGVSFLIRDGIEGLLFPARDAVKATELIVKIHENQDVASFLASNASLRAEDMFSAKKTVSLYSELFCDV